MRKLLDQRAVVGCNAEYGGHVMKLENPFTIDQEKLSKYFNN